MAIRDFEGHSPIISDSAFVDSMALVIGDVHLGDGASVWPMCVLRGDINRIRVGSNTNIQDGTIIHVNHASEFNPEGDPVIIGNDVTIGHQAVIHACTIEDRALIGMGAKVLDKAVIQSEVYVGAGSVVAPGKVLESGFLYVGTPAKKARPLTDDEIKYLAYSAEYYASLQARHRATLEETHT